MMIMIFIQFPRWRDRSCPLLTPMGLITPVVIHRPAGKVCGVSAGRFVQLVTWPDPPEDKWGLRRMNRKNLCPQ